MATLFGMFPIGVEVRQLSRGGLNGPQRWSTVHRQDRCGWTRKRCRPVVFDLAIESSLES
jgi:hypothetical protein